MGLVSKITNLVALRMPKLIGRCSRSTVNQIARCENKPLFCQQYWANIRKQGKLSTFEYKSAVPNHGHLHDLNPFLVRGGDKPIPEFEKILKTYDIDFRRLPETTETIVGYRGISKKLEWDSDFGRYTNLLNSKKGDVIYMPEYAFFAPDRAVAERHMPGWGGDILIEAHFPEKSQLSIYSDEFVARRGSRFECLGKEIVKDENNDYTKIILRYILPDNSFKAIM